jgi:hypothetical protein
MLPPSKTDPRSYLDEAIVRVAVLQARKLIAQGVAAEEALRLACPGSWSSLRLLVLARLDPPAPE